MINFDDYTNENIIEHNSKWPYIPDHPYRILIVGGSGSGKTNALLNLINNQPDIDKIYLNPIKTELVIRGRKLTIYIVFITQSYFKVPKDVRLNSTHFFIMKILNKRELQQTALNHSSDIDFKDFMNIYKKCTKEPYSFLVNDTTLPSDDRLRFRKNLLG